MTDRSKLKLLVIADVLAWVLTAWFLTLDTHPGHVLHVGTDIVRHLAVAGVVLLTMRWLFASMLRELFESHVRDYFGVYVAAYLKGAADHAPDDRPPGLQLVEGGRR